MTIDVLSDAVVKLNETAKAWAELKDKIGENKQVDIMGKRLMELTKILENEFHDIVIETERE